MLSSGCCSGEDVRGGDLVNLQTCAANYKTQSFGWPSPSFLAAPNAIPALAMGEPDVSPSPAQLVLDDGGLAFPGIAAQLHSYSSAANSAFAPNGSASSGYRLVHIASGLCLDASGEAAQRSPPLTLAKCDIAKQVKGDFFGSQLFEAPPIAPAAGALINSRGLCVSAERVLGASNTIAGEARLAGATCGAVLPPSQTFLSCRHCASLWWRPCRRRRRRHVVGRAHCPHVARRRRIVRLCLQTLGG